MGPIVSPSYVNPTSQPVASQLSQAQKSDLWTSSLYAALKLAFRERGSGDIDKLMVWPTVCPPPPPSILHPILGDTVWCYLPEGLLGLEKGTNCGPTPQELWLSQANMAKKRGVVQ